MAIVHIQAASDKAKKDANLLAAETTRKAGVAAPAADETFPQNWEEVKPEKKVEQYADKASKTVQASPAFSLEGTNYPITILGTGSRCEGKFRGGGGL